MFTEQETKLLVGLLNQVQIKPSEPNALELVNTVQSILSKLQPPDAPHSDS